MEIGATSSHVSEPIVIKRILSFVMVAVLCLGLMPPLPASAWAEDAGEATAQSSGVAGTATLQIVFGVAYDGTPNVIVDKSYGFYADATYEDLLDAAVAAGDIKAYALNGYGYLSSITKADGTVIAGASDYTTYWSQYEDGSYYGGSDTIATEVLATDTKYQLAWASYPTAVAPDWSKVVAPAQTDTTHIAGGGTAAGTATLQIAFGDNAQNSLLVNKKYSFSSGATYEDLLDAAVAAGDIKAYALNGYGYLSSITKADGTVIAGASDYTTYWSQYEDGSYYGGSDTIATEVLATDTKYQLAWASYPTAVAPDWDDVAAPATGSTTAGTAPSGDSDSGGSGSNGSGESATTAAVDGDKVSNLFSSIAASYAGVGTDWKVVDMAAAGYGASVDSATVVSNAIAAYKDPDGTNIQRSIIALTALGINATAVIDATGTYDLVGKLAVTAGSQDTLMGRAFALLAYESGSYAVPDGAIYSKSELIDLLAAAQLQNGAFVSANDSDSTAMVIPALASYYETNATAKTTVDNALAALKTMQKSDGGFASSYDASDASNADSTAMVVVALCSMGIDPSTKWVTDNGGTPLSSLLSFANASQTAFTFNGVDDDFTTEEGFRALVAYQGLQNTGAAYNIYIQAKDATAGLASEGDDLRESDTQSQAAESSSDTTAASATSTPTTGDDSPSLAIALLLTAALATAGYARRRKVATGSVSGKGE